MVAGIVSVILPVVVLTIQSADGDDRPAAWRRRRRAWARRRAAASARVVWPLALPGIATAGVLCFILAMNAYATPYLLGGPRFQMMAPLIYWEFCTNNNWPFAVRPGADADGGRRCC